MFDQTSMKFMEEFFNASSPSGYETAAAKIFRNYLKNYCDEVRGDVLGNTITVLNPQAACRVMLAGHYDEIGFQITYIDEGGLLYFHAVGGIDKLNVPSTEVNIITRNGMVRGVIGKKPIHLLKTDERNKALELSDMWIDIGVDSRAEAEKLVAVGDPVAVKNNFHLLNANRFYSKGTDDKIGAFIVAETMRRLSERQLNVAVYGVGTVQEEVGLRGSRPASYEIDPQIGFGIDVGFTSDLPDIPKKTLGDCRLGGGPILIRNCDNNVKLGDLLRDVAKQHNIPYQDSVGFKPTGGTDTASIQMTRSGVATALFSIPNRYMHSPVEICDLRDAEASVNLLVETISGFTGHENFCPGCDEK